MKKSLAALGALLFAAVAFAQTALPPVEGEVRKIDTEANKITLRHGDIPNLEMTGMTMVFRVKDPALLTQVKPGDKVRFTADKVDGALTVLSIAPAN
ncbi:copper-binding protein [Variovorax sp.]|uniref:copper-binding protein n=1 Tax=Variovorax sp. TaxID=1871043 RepID=UPI0012288888|nr:copper-binding protein [Variovorax sp.]TAJ66890.1 MAG: copper-binding protein [Variovorax sp.]